MANESSNSGGIGFLGMLTILFIALKLTGYITWSWWWVLAPAWIGIATVLVAMLGLAIFVYVNGNKK